jgi:hypothetical protein
MCSRLPIRYACIVAGVKRILVILLSFSLAACVFMSRRLDVQSISTRTPVTVSSPVKAHLKDGSTVVYPWGVAVTADALVGEGSRHDATLKNATSVERVDLSEVLGLESYRTRTNGAESFLVSSLATAGAVVGTALLAVAIFGSCPTVYSDDGEVEEAELFSSSIAPLFEGRDIDRLHAQADARGIVTLDIRNEAMETHYINHLQLLAVEHGPGEVVVPNSHGTPIVVGTPRPAAIATSRDGRDLRDTLAERDERFYLTDRRIVDGASAKDMDDWIDLSVPVEQGATSAALVFRMRNSLLNTTLLYEVMLGPSGAAAIDWLGEGLTKISTAVELGRWHQRRAGLHVSVWQNGGYREVARVPDSGPISWHDVAAVVPVPADETHLRVRLSYLADHWRIDQLGVSFATRDASARSVPLSTVTGRNGKVEATAFANMSAPDDKYLQTNPGQSFVARFDAGRMPTGRSRTFLLSSQGYYTEWIRGSWVREATVTEPFMPSDEAILTAMKKWGTTRESFEKRFLRARVPVQ